MTTLIELSMRQTSRKVLALYTNHVDRLALPLEPQPNVYLAAAPSTGLAALFRRRYLEGHTRFHSEHGS